MLYDSQRLKLSITRIDQQQKGDTVQDNINIKNLTWDNLEQRSCNNSKYTSIYALGVSRKILESHEAVKIVYKEELRIYNMDRGGGNNQVSCYLRVRPWYTYVPFLIIWIEMTVVDVFTAQTDTSYLIVYILKDRGIPV